MGSGVRSDSRTSCYARSRAFGLFGETVQPAIRSAENHGGFWWRMLYGQRGRLGPAQPVRDSSSSAILPGRSAGLPRSGGGQHPGPQGHALGDGGGPPVAVAGRRATSSLPPNRCAPPLPGRQCRRSGYTPMPCSRASPAAQPPMSSPALRRNGFLAPAGGWRCSRKCSRIVAQPCPTTPLQERVWPIPADVRTGNEEGSSPGRSRREPLSLLVGQVGADPTTPGLKVRSSTAELLAHKIGWGGRIRTCDRGSKVRCLTAWRHPTTRNFPRISLLHLVPCGQRDGAPGWSQRGQYPMPCFRWALP